MEVRTYAFIFPFYIWEKKKAFSASKHPLATTISFPTRNSLDFSTSFKVSPDYLGFLVTEVYKPTSHVTLYPNNITPLDAIHHNICLTLPIHRFRATCHPNRIRLLTIILHSMIPLLKLLISGTFISAHHLSSLYWNSLNSPMNRSQYLITWVNIYPLLLKDFCYL